MSAPFEIIAAPFTAWLALTGTAFPLIDVADDDLAADWKKIGTSGNLNYSRDGVKVMHSQTTNKYRSLGDTGSRKIFRTEEDLKISLILNDVSLEQYAIALNHNAVSTVAAGMGTAGYKKLGLSRGALVTQRSLLVRGPSPYDETAQLQYEVPICVHTGSPEVVYQLGDPAGLAIELEALVYAEANTADERFGRLIAFTDVALS